jgi:predicted N-formylglutamate amidohydrolase
VTAELLALDEPPAFELIEGRPEPPIVFVCDHASNRIPRALGDLGVGARYLQEHIAWDIGAAGVARRLAERFAASAIIASYSRLVIDLNRNLRDASAYPAISDGVLVPGNLGLDDAARELRRRALYEPYHGAIASLLDALTTKTANPAFIGIHSFTPRFHGTERPWRVGVLWDSDPRLPVPLLAALRARGGFVVGDNEPYSGRHRADYSVDHHAERRGLAHVGIEIRQDSIADPAGQDRWAGIVGDALAEVLADESCFDPSLRGSRP